MSGWEDELADLLADDRSKDAYEYLRERFYTLPTWEIRRRHVAERKLPSRFPPQTEQEIDARHDRAVADCQPKAADRWPGGQPAPSGGQRAGAHKTRRDGRARSAARTKT